VTCRTADTSLESASSPTDLVTRSELISQLERDIAASDSDIQLALGERVAGGFHAWTVDPLELLGLRAAARDRLGDRFEIRSFHDVVLGSGAVALSTLRMIVDDWIRSLRG
jgi:uncharacterized protein (DUF885 family)